MSVSAASSPATAQKVFISYRRKETAAYAGWLYDRMVARFGEDNIFMDMEMAPGIDFHERITEVVSGCVVLLVLIGPDWAAATEEDGSRRLDNPVDFVRLEIETGLRRPDVTPIPVLVGGARMPKREDLPPGSRRSRVATRSSSATGAGPTTWAAWRTRWRNCSPTQSRVRERSDRQRRSRMKRFPSAGGCRSKEWLSQP